MSLAVMVDGSVVDAEHATVSVFDRGFLYGDSVFETVRTYHGRPFALGEHLDRLQRSAARVFIELPVPLGQLAGEVRELVFRAGNDESYVRVMVTRGRGALGLDPSLAGSPSRVIIVAPLTPPPQAAYTDGIAAVTYRTQRVTEATDAAGAKVGNYLVAVLAMREAHAAGAGEALIVDGRGFIIEGATSNVFAVIGGTLVTPPEDAGILPGITRGLLLGVAADLGVPTVLRELALDEARGADELFISSSIRELLPVVRLDGAAVGPGVPGPTSLRLLAAFRDKVEQLQALAD